jgi:predicted dehydrogenase
VLLPPNPNDPMMMWRSTAVAGGNPPKRGWDVLANETNWYPLDIKRFVDCLETGARPDITVEEASLSLEVLMAAYQSAASNSTVAVERL